VALNVRGAYISFPAVEVKRFFARVCRDGLNVAGTPLELPGAARRAIIAVTLPFMHSGPTFRLRSSTSTRAALTSVASARANCRVARNAKAKAKKQSLI
jgi:hypothetical protein